MGALEVRIVELEPMRVASARGFGTRPEPEAWEQVLAYADRAGLDLRAGRHRFFGFNDPPPSPNRPEYGYEQWITVGPDAVVDPPLTVGDVPGGRYAVARCESLTLIGERWRELAGWLEENGYAAPTDETLCLEELVSDVREPFDRWVFDLYVALPPD